MIKKPAGDKREMEYFLFSFHSTENKRRKHLSTAEYLHLHTFHLSSFFVEWQNRELNEITVSY